MKQHFDAPCAWAIAILFLALSGCSKQETAGAPKFDPDAIAAEADKGNLEPLKQLNAACTTEIERGGKRGPACNAQDDVGALRKPLNVRF